MLSRPNSHQEAESSSGLHRSLVSDIESYPAARGKIDLRQSHICSRGSQFSLTYAEFADAHSLASLELLYKLKGLEFASTSELLDKVKADWELACTKEAYDHSQLPQQTIQPIIVTVAGIEYHIFGFPHISKAYPGHLAQIRERSREYPSFAIEEGLLSFVDRSRAIEIQDHQLFKLQDLISFIAKNLVNKLRRLGKGIYRGLPIDSGGAGGEGSRLLHPPMSLLYNHSVPIYLILEAKGDLKAGYHIHTRRSAGLAAVLKSLNCLASPRAIFCGNGHAEEIKYFLHHPLSDPEIESFVEATLRSVNSGRYSKKYGEPASWREFKSDFKKTLAFGILVGSGVTTLVATYKFVVTILNYLF